MNSLNAFHDCDISWDLAPEDAVTMYLEWGNNDWHGKHAPVRSKNDVSIYFVVDSWENPPRIRLIRRNSETAEELTSVPVPEHLLPDWRAEYGGLRGVFAPTAAILQWLRKAVDGPAHPTVAS